MIQTQTSSKETATNTDLLQLVMIRSESGETLRGNLTSWTVSNATSKEIKIELQFDQPLHVSQGDQPDKLLVMINFDGFNDIYGGNLLPRILKLKNLPPQIASSKAITI